MAALAVALAVAWVRPLGMHVWKGGSAADLRSPTDLWELSSSPTGWVMTPCSRLEADDLTSSSVNCSV